VSHTPKSQRREVQLEPGLQAKLLAQMRAEQESRLRSIALRRYLLLPLVLGALVWSTFVTFYGDSTMSMVGNLVGTSLLWFLWKVRTRLSSVFGFASG
jgi:hypothetical protein